MPFIMAILLATLLTDCRSTEIVTVEKTRVPLLDFPEFPLADNMTDNKDGTVTVDSQWVVNLEEYHIRYEEVKKNYFLLKSLYEKD